MKQTTIYEVQIVTANRRQRKFCFTNKPTGEDVAAAIAVEIAELRDQIDNWREEDDEDGCYEHSIDGANAEIEVLGCLIQVAYQAVWSEVEKGTYPITFAGTRVGEIRVEELKAYKR